MRLLRTLPVDTTEPVNYVCYHPVAEKWLLRGEHVEPSCCAIEITNSPIEIIEEIVRQYDAMPDGILGKGFTNEPFLRAKEFLKEIAR